MKFAKPGAAGHGILVCRESTRARMPPISTRTLLVAAALGAAGCPPPRADLGMYTETETDDGEDGESARTEPDGATSSEDPSTGTSTGEPVDPSGTTGHPGTTGETGGESGSDTGMPTSTGEEDPTGEVPPGLCGDGRPGPSEACDDGNAQTDDGCLPDCTLGPGGKLRSLDLPPIADELLRCFTRVGSPFLGDSTEALVLGGHLPAFGPDGQWGAHVWHVPLPEGKPASWSYAQHAGVHGRLPYRAATAANGDVVVAGLVWTEDLEVDSGGHLWLARFTPAGGLSWSHETPGLKVAATDLIVTPAGNIVLSGPCAGVCDGGTVAVFDPAGALLWKDEAQVTMEKGSTYTGAAVDGESRVYIVGTRADVGFQHLVVRGFAAEGGVMWTRELVSPLAPRFAPRDITLTSEDALVVVMSQFDEEQAPLDALGMVAFDRGSGEALWWQSWTAKDPGAAEPSRLVPTTDGGYHIVGRLAHNGETAATLVTRFDSEGQKVWANLIPGGEAGRDALLDEDGLLYVLTSPGIDIYLP